MKRRDVKAGSQLHLSDIDHPHLAATLCLPLCTLAMLAFLPQDLHICCSLGLEHSSPTILPTPANLLS